MTEDSEEVLEALKARILFPWQAQRGSHVWAPWGKSGWSAVEINKPSRKWATGFRIKPKTGGRGAAAKVPITRLIKRDPKLKGKDKPALSPDEVFAHIEETEARHAKEDAERRAQKQQEAEHKEKAPKPKPAPEPAPAPSDEEEAERLKRLERLFDLLDDGSTTDDW